MYRQIMKYLNLDEDYKNDPKYIKLVQGLTKKRQFQAVVDERKMELQ